MKDGRVSTLLYHFVFLLVVFLFIIFQGKEVIVMSCARSHGAFFSELEAQMLQKFIIHHSTYGTSLPLLLFPSDNVNEQTLFPVNIRGKISLTKDFLISTISSTTTKNNQ